MSSGWPARLFSGCASAAGAFVYACIVTWGIVCLLSVVDFLCHRLIVDISMFSGDAYVDS